VPDHSTFSKWRGHTVGFDRPGDGAPESGRGPRRRITARSRRWALLAKSPNPQGLESFRRSESDFRPRSTRAPSRCVPKTAGKQRLSASQIVRRKFGKSTTGAAVGIRTVGPKLHRVRSLETLAPLTSKPPASHRCRDGQAGGRSSTASRSAPSPRATSADRRSGRSRSPAWAPPPGRTKPAGTSRRIRHAVRGAPMRAVRSRRRREAGRSAHTAERPAGPAGAVRIARLAPPRPVSPSHPLAVGR
jgi:hypothetical protein